MPEFEDINPDSVLTIVHLGAFRYVYNPTLRDFSKLFDTLAIKSTDSSLTLVTRISRELLLAKERFGGESNGNGIVPPIPT
jgi:hypothetical protein